MVFLYFQGHLGDNPFDSASEWSKTHFAAAATPWPHATRQSRLSVSKCISIQCTMYMIQDNQNISQC